MSKTPRRELLEEAADLIDGDRNITYGSPTQNFQNIADLWTTRFSHMLKDGRSFTAVDVADAMVLVKIARNVANTKRDNFADIAGYAACGYEASLEEDEPEPDPRVKDWAVSITTDPGGVTMNSLREHLDKAFNQHGGYR